MGGNVGYQRGARARDWPDAVPLDISGVEIYDRQRAKAIYRKGSPGRVRSSEACRTGDGARNCNVYYKSSHSAAAAASLSTGDAGSGSGAEVNGDGNGGKDESTDGACFIASSADRRPAGAAADKGSDDDDDDDDSE